jgi:hypothetical protein
MDNQLAALDQAKRTLIDLSIKFAWGWLMPAISIARSQP